MQPDNQTPAQEPEQSNPLDGSDELEQASEITNVEPTPTAEPANISIKDKAIKVAKTLNIYMLLFVLIIIVAIFITIIAAKSANDAANKSNTNNSQNLSEKDLKDLRSTETKVGDPKQTLNIESNSVFTGKVLMRDSLDVAGAIRVGGSLSLPGITVSGTSDFDVVQANNLNVAGNTTVQGDLVVQRNFNVSGGATIGGPLSAAQLNVDRLQLNQDIQLNRHIDAGGSTPSVTSGGAIGNGGTVSISGTDTAGTVTINTGNNPSPGVLATINFTAAFSQTPHIAIGPVNAGAAGLSYYITRTANSFTISVTNAAPGQTTFGFDYIAID